MNHPDVGDKIEFKPMYEDKYISGIVDWVGSSQFGVVADDNPKLRELILFSEDRWKAEKKTKTKAKTETPDEIEEDVEDEAG